MKVTLQEQIVADIKTAMEIADEALGEKKQDITQDNYYYLLNIIFGHIHYCLDTYRFIDENKEETRVE